MLASLYLYIYNDRQFCKEGIFMNKKKVLLLITTASFAATAMAVVALGQNMDILSLEQTKANGPEYSLLFTKDTTFGTYAGKGGMGFTYTNSRGATFGFFKNSGVTKNSHDAALYYDGNQDNCVLIESSYNASESIVDSINGITSLTVDFGGTYYQDPGTPDVIPTVYFGFVEGSTAIYTHQHVLQDNVAYDFDGLLPSCFKVVISNATATSKWYRGWINSLNLTYSCSESDTLKEAWLDDYFASTPKNIVRDGEDKIVSFESGAYPQTKASSSASTYLEANYSSLTPIVNDYYFYEGLLYARKQSAGTGYQEEYVESNYYWFEVNPVVWLVVSNTGNEYLVKSEKVLEDNIQFHNSLTPQLYYYQNSTLCTYINGMYNKMFRNDNIIQARTSGGFGGAKLYPLTYKEYGSNTSIDVVYEDAIGYTTDYTRTARTATYLSTTYWTNVFFNQDSKNRAYMVQYENGVTYHVLATVREAIRPGMTIVIE